MGYAYDVNDIILKKKNPNYDKNCLNKYKII